MHTRLGHDVLRAQTTRGPGGILIDTAKRPTCCNVITALALIRCCPTEMSCCRVPALLSTMLLAPAGRRAALCAPACAMAKQQHTYAYPRPALTVDIALVAKPSDSSPAAQVLLIQRKHEPCKVCGLCCGDAARVAPAACRHCRNGQWALPGGFVDEGEPLAAAAARELQEETSIHAASVELSQVGAFGDPGRDPRGWTVTVAYAALVPDTQLGVQAADDAADARWFPLAQLPPLAFDHKLVLRSAFAALAQRGNVAPGSELAAQLEQGAAALAGPWEPPQE